IWIGVRHWPPVIAIFVLVGLTSALSFATGLLRLPSRLLLLPVFVLSTIMFMSTTMLFGPLVLPPVMIGLNTAIFTLYLPTGSRWFAAIFGGIAVLLPSLFWLAGIIPGYRIDGDAIVLDSTVLAVNAVPLVVFVIAAAVGAVVMGVFSVTRIRD